LGLDTFRQFELHHSAFQAVLGMPHFEIDVACQIILKEAHPQFKSQQADGIIQIDIIVFSQELIGDREVALQDSAR
jgi:hypothetical protein